MSDITLHYFDIYGRAEVLRTILNYSGTPFTDHRISFEDWGQLKNTGFAEFSQLPVIDIDGHRLSQTQSISRYLCNKLGFGVTDPEESYYVESLCDLFEDIATAFGTLMFTKDMEGINKLFQDKVPQWLRLVETRLERNNHGNGFFVGAHPTRADFHAFVALTEIINKFHPELIDQNAPKLRL